jgi:hypothetical protein
MTAGKFADWCALVGRQPVPAAPALVAQFVAEIAPMGIDKVWAAVQEISRAHYLIGLADPTLGGPVAAAINDIAKIDPPQSWPEDERAKFLALPYDLQKFVAEEEKRQSRIVKVAIQEAAEARKSAGLPKLTKKFYRDAGKEENAEAKATAHA